MSTISGRRGGRASEKSGARGMAMDEDRDEQRYNELMNKFQATNVLSRAERAELDALIAKGKSPSRRYGDEYRDEEFEEGELLRGKQDDRDEALVSQHGRWGSRATDKAGARDVYATDPPVSEAQRKAMWAAKSGNSTLGIPKSVGAEFAKADPGGKLP